MSWSKSDDCKDDKCDDQEEYHSYYANTITADYEYLQPVDDDHTDLTIFPDIISTPARHRFLSLSPHTCMQAYVASTNRFVSTEPIYPLIHNVLWDSGCSHIMFNQAGAFIDLNRQIRGEVKVADGTFIPICGFGTVALWNPLKRECIGALENVLYVPDLHENLVGHKAMCKQGFSYDIEPNSTPTLTRDGIHICRLVEAGDL